MDDEYPTIVLSQKSGEGDKGYLIEPRGGADFYKIFVGIRNIRKGLVEFVDDIPFAIYEFILDTLTLSSYEEHFPSPNRESRLEERVKETILILAIVNHSRTGNKIKIVNKTIDPPVVEYYPLE